MMIGTSVYQLIFIRTCIFLLQYGTLLVLLALSLLVLCCGRAALSHLFGKIALGYCILDLLYASFIYLPYSLRLKQEAQHPPGMVPAERRALFMRCVDHVPDLDRYIRMWFLGSDKTEIKRENVRDFLLWAFFDCAPGYQTEADNSQVEEFIRVIEVRGGREFTEGRGQAQSLRLTLDAIEIRYRSFVWFVIVAVVDLATHCILWAKGFEYHAQAVSSLFSVLLPRAQSLFAKRRSVSAEMSYWHRPHTAGDKLPIVFLHGIGIGLWPYMPWLSKISKVDGGDTQIGVIAVEILPVSFRLTGTPLGKVRFLRELGLVLNEHGWDKFVLAAHSYGTTLATHVVHSKELAPRMSSVVLIDPVSILLHLPDVAYNFTRRQPRRANEWQLHYFASTDLGIAHTLGRHFFWKENIVWKSELLGLEGPEVDGEIAFEAQGRKRRKVAVCLAEHDLIVDTLAVAQYLAGDEEWLPAGQGGDGCAGAQSAALRDVGQQRNREYVTQSGVEILWFLGRDHGQMFESPVDQDRIRHVVQKYCRK